MWGMISEHSIPTPPDAELLREFNQRFSEAGQIEDVLATRQSTALIAAKEIQMLRDAKVGRMKLSKGAIHISQVFIEYMWATMAKLGMRVWAPDLDAQPDSLYNEACRLSAITTFRQAVINKVYAYMGINNQHVTDMVLLQRVYDHYVHYYMAGIYAKEKKEKGKHTQDELKKSIQGCRQRVSFPFIAFKSGAELMNELWIVMQGTIQVCHQQWFSKALHHYPQGHQSSQR